MNRTLCTKARKIIEAMRSLGAIPAAGGAWAINRSGRLFHVNPVKPAAGGGYNVTLVGSGTSYWAQDISQIAPCIERLAFITTPPVYSPAHPEGLVYER